MSRVGEQRHRALREADPRLDRDEAEVEHDADGERAAEVGGRVIVTAVMVVMP